MKTFLFIAVVVVAGLTWWFIDRGGIYRTEHRAYRFEVTVDTPEGLKTAYSVHEVTIQDTTWTPARNYLIDLVGEAVPFELKDGRILFATLDPVSGYPFEALLGGAIENGSWIDIREKFDFQLREKSWPRLAIIDAADKPDTLRRVADEDEIQVTAARLVSTDGEATDQVARLLPWLVAAKKAIPSLSTEITEHHEIVSSLKFGVR